MRHKITVVLIVLICALFLVTAISSAVAAPKYVLAYWRELGKNEVTQVQSNWYPTESWAETVKHQIKIRVFDENGNGVGADPVTGATTNVYYKTIPGVPGGTPTNTGLSSTCNGEALPIDLTGTIDNALALTMSSTTNSAESDLSPLMAGRRYYHPSFFHGWPANTDMAYWSCGYELGFLKLADAANPGTFNTTLVSGPENDNIAPGATEINKAPYTTSLAYSSTLATDSTTDQAHQGIGPNIAQRSYGQTFVANGDRVMAIQAQTVISMYTSFRLNLQVFKCDGSGNPTATPVCEVKRITGVDGNVAKTTFTFGVNECPVVPGQTYYYKIWSDNLDLMAYVVGNSGNNYPAGKAYTGDTAQPLYDLVGFVCCMTYGSTNLGNISGIVRDDVGVALASALVSVQVSPTVTRTTYSDSTGAYSFLNVAPGYYSLTADRALNCPGTGLAIVPDPTGTYPNVTLQTGTANIACTRVVNKVLNPSFEDPITHVGSFANWTQVDDGLGSQFYWCQEGQGWPHEGFGEAGFDGTVYAGGSMQGGTHKHGMASQIVNGLTVGHDYTVSSFIRTTQRQESEKPENLWCMIGVDKAGGTDFSAATWSAQQFPFYQWQFVTTDFTATNTSATVYLSYDLVAQGAAFVFAEFDNVGLYEKCPAPIIGTIPIASAFGYPDGRAVNITNALVTASKWDEWGSMTPQLDTFNGAFYIEDLNRSAAIRVVCPTLTEVGGGLEDPLAIDRKDTVNITGVMGTNSDGERFIYAPWPNVVWAGASNQPLPEALYLNGRDLGGVSFNANTKGVYSGKGLYNVGKLVAIFGKITYRDPAGAFFYIDDGSALVDGNGVAAAKGVRIDVSHSPTNWTIPTQTYAKVTGIVTKKLINGNEVRVVRPIANTVTYVKGY